MHRKFSNMDDNGGSVELFRDTSKALVITGLQIDGGAELRNIDKAIEWGVKQGEKHKEEAREEKQRERAGNGHDHSGGRDSIDEIDQIVREGAQVVRGNRSNTFHSVVGHFIGCGWSVDKIVDLLERHPQGIGARYIAEGRLRGEVERSADAFGGEREQEDPELEDEQPERKRKSEPPPDDTGLVALKASSVTMEAIEWLWLDRIAKGKLTLIAGEPGLAKSQLTLRIAATTTTGGKWPGGSMTAIGNVIIMSAEDAPEDTIVPRLKAADADLTAFTSSRWCARPGAMCKPIGLSICSATFRRSRRWSRSWGMCG